MESIVKPLKPAAPWLGGKTKLLGEILPLIEAKAHTTYVEVFFGMGAVFFGRHSVPKAEVINDRNSELHNFFWQLQQHYQQLMDELKWKITSRQHFEILASQDPATLTELQRAARFIYLLKTAFGGKASGQTFGVSIDRGARFDFDAVAPYLQEVHHRLAGVVLENLDWRDLIDRYDAPGTLFYLDPPYYGGEGDYGPGLFARADYADMAARLQDIEGRFILSLNDVPEVRDIFAAFPMREVATTYTVAKDGATPAGELLISNGPLAAAQGDLLA